MHTGARACSTYYVAIIIRISVNGIVSISISCVAQILPQIQLLNHQCDKLKVKLTIVKPNFLPFSIFFLPGHPFGSLLLIPLVRTFTHMLVRNPYTTVSVCVSPISSYNTYYAFATCTYTIYKPASSPKTFNSKFIWCPIPSVLFPYDAECP